MLGEGLRQFDDPVPGDRRVLRQVHVQEGLGKHGERIFDESTCNIVNTLNTENNLELLYSIH